MTGVRYSRKRDEVKGRRRERRKQGKKMGRISSPPLSLSLSSDKNLFCETQNLHKSRGGESYTKPEETVGKNV